MKKLSLRFSFYLAIVCVMVFNNVSQAVLVTNTFENNPTLKIVDFSQFTSQTFSSGPVQIGELVEDDIVWTTTQPNGHSVIGTTYYGFGSKGGWIGSFVGLEGTIGQEGYMLFQFNDRLLNAVGGFINYVPYIENNATTHFDVFIDVLDINGVVLESHNISERAPVTITGTNQGAFRGILRPTMDIAAFRVWNSYVALDDLTYTSIPEPATISMIILGSLLLRKRKA